MNVRKEKANLINLTIRYHLNHYRLPFRVQLKIKIQAEFTICRARIYLLALPSFSRRSARIFMMFFAMVSCTPGLESPEDGSSLTGAVDVVLAWGYKSN